MPRNTPNDCSDDTINSLVDRVLMPSPDHMPLRLTDTEWFLIETALRTAREQWGYDRTSMSNTGQHHLAGQFARQCDQALDLLTKIENREE